MAETRTTCCYCGVGCGVVIEHDGRRITGVHGDPDHPANSGKLCSKGSTLHLTAQPPTQRFRATHPLVRPSRGEPFARATWDATLDTLADRFAECIRTHGPDSVAFYLSGQLLTEDYYAFNKLSKGLIGTNNVDTNSRLCMSSAVSGYKATLGVDAPPACYEDIDHADLIFIAGSNAAWAHPVLFRRIEAAKARNPHLKIVVVDPRRTATAEIADLHLAIEPGTDVALFHGMLHVMLWEDWVDTAYIAAHTSGFAELKALVREYTPKAVAEICGIGSDDVIKAARWFEEAHAALSLWCQGLNQSSSGTAKNAALINLHLATGQIGRPGAGPFSLTGQPNAMGGREVGGMATLLSAHRELANAQHRAEVAALWGIDEVPANPGKSAVELFESLAAGEVKMVWIACTNPAQSLPDQATVRAGLRRAELVVLQEAYTDTETAAFADVLLPATTWGEKDGTVTNSERRISRVRAAVPAPAEARHDWAIAVDFARRLEARLAPSYLARMPTLFPYASPADIFDEHAATTAGRDLDITGLSYPLLDARGPQQWPFPQGASEGTLRLYADGVFPTADGRARFAAVPYASVAEKTDARHPFRLNTGRLRDQWHAMSRTGTVAQLFQHAGEPRLQMHAADLARRHIAPGDLVRVASKRGAILVAVEASDELKPGHAFLPMHWGSASLGGDGAFGVNALTTSARCPISQQPELKHAAVRVTKAELPWRITAFGRAADGDALVLRGGLRTLLEAFPFASVTLIGRERPGVLFRAAAAAPVDATLLARIDAAFGLDGDDVVRYDDATRGVGRRILIAAGKLAAVRLAGDTAAESWLREWLVAEQDVATLRHALLLPTGEAPRGFTSRGRVVCTCFDVAEVDLRAHLATVSGPAEAALRETQRALKCGTNCGSCLPELKRVAAETRAVVPISTAASQATEDAASAAIACG
ncbi:MAG TPA: molybdopterin-dependent oxidoreductase [Casimicrobiaceae bacterium]